MYNGWEDFGGKMEKGMVSLGEAKPSIAIFNIVKKSSWKKTHLLVTVVCGPYSKHYPFQ